MTYPERGTSEEKSVTRHGHVHTSQSVADARVLRLPVAHNESLETELAFKDIVLEVAVLASIGVIDLGVRAHDSSRAGADCICEGPGFVSFGFTRGTACELMA